MCPIVDGQPVNAAVTNNEKLDRQSDDTAFGVITLNNSDPASSGTINNLQGSVNELFRATGVNEGLNDGMQYAPVPGGTIVVGENHEISLRKLANLFQGVTGHNHSGVDGDGPTVFIPPATTGTPGAVTFPTADPEDVSEIAFLGTTGGPVAYADHEHRGVRSVSVSGDSELFGDITFSPGLNIDLSQTSGGDIEIIGDITSISGADIDGSIASNTSRITIPKDTKANLDALTRKEGTIVYATDTDKVYYDDGSVLKAVGSGSGGGINFIPLSTTWAPDNQDNVDFETTIGNWVTYDNGAVSIPTTMTGGSPTVVSIARTTSAGQVLNGSASMLISKSAADAQGEGTSCVFNVPPGYSGKRALINIPYRVISGSLVQGDVKVFIYDVTNSVLITPFNNDLVGSNGTIQAMYDVPNSTANVQMRVGFHFCTTSTTAVSISVDDASVGALDIPVGGVVTNRYRYIAQLNGSNFPSSPTVVENTLNGSLTVSYPSNYVARFVANRSLDVFITGSHGAISNSTGAAVVNTITKNGTTIDRFVAEAETASSRNQYAKVAARVQLAAGDILEMASNLTGSFASGANSYVEVEAIETQTATITQSTTFNLSQVLASGTRVTTTPTRLGEYRTQTWQNGGFSLADSSTGAPSVSDGMRISTRSGTSGTSPYPNRWDIYVGPNKAYQQFFYEGAGKTTQQDASLGSYANTVDWGFGVSYNQITGILTLLAHSYASGSGRTFSAQSAGTDGYFDILVSETAQPMAVVAPNIEFYVDTGNGHGSTNNKIRRYSNVRKNVGNGYSESAAGGAVFTAPEDGIYQFTIVDRRDGGQGVMGISVNSSALTTSIESLDYSQGYRGCVYAPSVVLSSYTSPAMRLKKGDEVRPHTDGNLTLSDSRVLFSGWQVSK